MTTSKKLKCAVIGVGYLGKFHADKYANLPNAELVAVCDLNAQTSAEIAAKHSVPAYTDYLALIKEVKPDAVSIVVPTSLHYKTAKAFLENGIHVLLEKPITTTIKEANALIDLARRHKVVFQIGHLERFNPALLSVQKLIDHPLFIESIRVAPFKLRGTDVCVNLDLMIHDIDIVQHLVKSPIKHIQASGAPVLSENIDIAHAHVEFVNGCVANFTASRISTKPSRKLRVFQHNAFFAADLDNKTLTISRKGSAAINKINDKGKDLSAVPELIKEEMVLEKGDAILDEIKAFVTSVNTNTPPLVTGEDGKRALETALKITKLAAKGWKTHLKKK